MLSFSVNKEERVLRGIHAKLVKQGIIKGNIVDECHSELVGVYIDTALRNGVKTGKISDMKLSYARKLLTDESVERYEVADGIKESVIHITERNEEQIDYELYKTGILIDDYDLCIDEEGTLEDRFFGIRDVILGKRGIDISDYLVRYVCNGRVVKDIVSRGLSFTEDSQDNQIIDLVEILREESGMTEVDLVVFVREIITDEGLVRGIVVKDLDKYSVANINRFFSKMCKVDKDKSEVFRETYNLLGEKDLVVAREKEYEEDTVVLCNNSKVVEMSDWVSKRDESVKEECSEEEHDVYIGGSKITNDGDDDCEIKLDGSLGDIVQEVWKREGYGRQFAEDYIGAFNRNVGCQQRIQRVFERYIKDSVYIGGLMQGVINDMELFMYMYKEQCV